MHFADVHLGVENYGRYDPETGLHSRLVDFRDALNAAIDIAAAAARGIPVCGTESLGYTAAQQTIGQMLELSRRKGYEDGRLNCLRNALYPT